MDITNTSEYINALISAGADAMQNLYYIEFYSSELDSIKTALTVRASDIELPTFTHESNTKDFMTISFDTPKASFTGDKQLTINFRLDSGYEVYEYLLKQESLTSIPDLGFAATQVSSEGTDGDTGFRIAIYSMNQAVNSQSQEVVVNGSFDNGNYTKLYEFTHCWIKKLTRPNFSYANSEAQNITATIKFYDFDDPQNLLTRGNN